MDISFSTISNYLDWITSNIDEARNAILKECQSLRDLGKLRTADEVSAYAEKFKIFADENAAVCVEWEALLADISNASPEVGKIIHAVTDTPSTNNRKGKGNAPKMKMTLKATFPDGRVVQEGKDADTFVKTIELLGAERVAECGAKLFGSVLVTRNKSELLQISYLRRFPSCIKETADGWFVNTHPDKNAMIRILEKASKLLGAGLKVERASFIS